MPLLFLSLKELAMRAVLQEEVSFEDLPPPLNTELDKLSNFHGSYKLIETRSEKFIKTGGGAPTPEEINRIKSHGRYMFKLMLNFNMVLPRPCCASPPPTLSISKASKTSAHLWVVKDPNTHLVFPPSTSSTTLSLVYLPYRNVTYTLPSGNYWEASTDIGNGDVISKKIFFKRSTSTSGGDIPSIVVAQQEILFEMEEEVMKLTVKSIVHKVDPDIECSQCYVFQRN